MIHLSHYIKNKTIKRLKLVVFACFILLTCSAAVSAQQAPSAAQQAERYAAKFPKGSIMSVLPGLEEKNENWSLATSQAPENIQGVFEPEDALLIPGSESNSSITAAERGSPFLIKKRIVLNNIAFVRYNLENGAIHKGDYITISSAPGVGMKAIQSGFTVGVALENSDAAEKPGLIKIRVMVRYEKFD